MENEYLRENKRELEITKNISLKALDPVKLDELRYNRKCTFKLPELLFDLDHPGHYYRRIKSLSISIPCVVGPYSGVNCTLRLVNSETRKEPEDGLKPDPSNSDKISLSTGQNDSGLFELNHNDERYLPFELRGVVSKWELEFPSTLEQFDRSTISDVIMHIRYTALMGDEKFKQDVNLDIVNTYNTFRNDENSNNPTGMAQRLDIRREFPDLWHKFISDPDISSEHKLTLTLTKEHFPYLLQPLKIKATHLSIFCELKKELATDKTLQIYVNKMQTPSDPVTFNDMTTESTGKYFNSGTLDIKDFIVPDDLDITPNSNDFSIDKLKELVVVFHYQISSND
ncbi:hypothetical protein KA005_32590, partial [bacterium]|nr:hypothetical protein [bacterium]